MRLGVLAGIGKDWREALERVRIAEDLGYEHVATGEAWGPSALPFLTLVAANTSRITIGTSILNCFSRSPAVLAQEFAMLDQISEGRAVLGLGSSGARVIEHFHGVPFEKPLRRIRESVEIFDLLIAGEKLDYDGELFQLHRKLSTTHRIVYGFDRRQGIARPISEELRRRERRRVELSINFRDRRRWYWSPVPVPTIRSKKESA